MPTDSGRQRNSQVEEPSTHVNEWLTEIGLVGRKATR